MTHKKVGQGSNAAPKESIKVMSLTNIAKLNSAARRLARELYHINPNKESPDWDGWVEIVKKLGLYAYESEENEDEDEENIWLLYREHKVGKKIVREYVNLWVGGEGVGSSMMDGGTGFDSSVDLHEAWNWI